MPRVHIFWQKRIRANDTTTQWWYPSTTSGGELRDQRLAFPIMPGVHWRDVEPIVLEHESAELKVLSTEDAETQHAVPSPQHSAKRQRKEPAKPVLRSPGLKGGMWFEHEGIADEPEKPVKVKKEKPKAKIDPRLKGMARQLRDQWQERAEEIVPQLAAKHDVKRIAAAPAVDNAPIKLLDAA